MPPLIPYEKIADETWKRLRLASNDRSHPLGLFAVSTVDGQGHADCRTLVLRGANRETACLWFYTDVRAAKVAQLRANPAACAVAYERGDGVQLRIKGMVELHHENDLALRHWEQVEFHIHHSYATPFSPGQSLRHPDPKMREYRQRPDALDMDAARRNFAVMEMKIDLIDWLQIGEAGDQRALLRPDLWQPEPIAP